MVHHFGIDPASRLTGWAYLTERRDAGGRLLAPVLGAGGCGVISQPQKMPAHERIAAIVDELVPIVNGLEGEVMITLEIPSGKTHRKAGGAISGLPIYGMAAGAVFQAMRQLVGTIGIESLSLQVVPDNWTTDKKEKRAALVANRFPTYGAWREAGHDGGLDAADALGLAWRSYRAAEAADLERIAR